MGTFLRRTTVEPGATLPQEITLPRGRIVGISDGLGSLPAVMIWQEVVGISSIDDKIPHDRYNLWVCRHGQRVPPIPVGGSRTPPGWTWEGVVIHHHQPAAIYLLRLGPAPAPRSTDEVLDGVYPGTPADPFVTNRPGGTIIDDPTVFRGGYRGGW